MKTVEKEINVTCDNCIHRNVCGKKEDLDTLLFDIKKMMHYSKYEDFRLFVECNHAEAEKKQSNAPKSKQNLDEYEAEF